MNSVDVFCPGTIANLSCGFDILGLCLENIGDTMSVQKTQKKGIQITEIIGANLPFDIEKNVAGVAATQMLKHTDIDFGIEIKIHKKIRAGSGIGSSAASSAGVVFAINELLGKPFAKKQLVAFAMQGEKASSGSAHADNVAPAIYGGFTLVKDNNPLQVIELPVPKDLYVAIIHPKVEICTKDSRSVLKRNISTSNAVKQAANLGAFVSALYTCDYELMANSMVDLIAEPERSALIPKFDEVKKIAIQQGALGSGISGSGPSVYAICKGKEIAEKVACKMGSIYDNFSFKYDMYVSPIGLEGVQIIDS